MIRRLLAAPLLLAALSLLLFGVYEVAEQPQNQIFGRTLTNGPPDAPIIALTFDDGPNPPYTGEILRVLESEHVRATFFLVGRAAAAYPRVVRREVADGDVVGNHTWDHAHLILMDRAQIRSSLLRTQAAIFAASGVRTRLMRPPFGSRDWSVLQTARAMGYRVVMWSVPLARDWEQPSPKVIAARILPYVRDGSIIVLHDGNRGRLCALRHLNPVICNRQNDIEATRLIVRTLKARGYRFVTIPQLIAANDRRFRLRHGTSTPKRTASR